MRAVGLVLRGRLRQYWKSWLALSALVAVVGGLVMAAARGHDRAADGGGAPGLHRPLRV
jgi:hypothetical protein